MEKIKKGKIDKKGEPERIKLQIDLQNRQKNEVSDFFNNSGRNVKERLINAGKNFENIKQEIKKIIDNENLSNSTKKIIETIPDIIINKTTSIKYLNESIK